MTPPPNAPLDALQPCPHEHEQRTLGVTMAGTAVGNAPRWYVRCCDCDARGPLAGSIASATTAWNRRALPTDPSRAVLEAINDCAASFPPNSLEAVGAVAAREAARAALKSIQEARSA